MNPRGFHRNSTDEAPELRTDLGLTISLDAPVLISGEAAQARRVALGIHQRSPRSDGPFIAVSCARGEMPLARKAEVDLLAAGRLASGGTLFVEHIDQASPSMQHELMLVLEMTSEPTTFANRDVGGARVIGSADGDLYSRVRAQAFREDLFYRLNVIHLQVPLEAAALEMLPAADDPPEIEYGVPAQLPDAPANDPLSHGEAWMMSGSPAPDARSEVRTGRADAFGEFPTEAGMIGEGARSASSTPVTMSELMTLARASMAAEISRIVRRIADVRNRIVVGSRVRRLPRFDMRLPVRAVPVLPFICGMVAGGSLVVMGNSTAEQRLLETARTTLPSGAFLNASQFSDLPPVEPIEDPATPRSGGVYRGSVRIDSQPSGAHVYLNNEQVGTTPLNLSGLPVGSRALRLEMPGYENWSAGITVSTERRTHITAHLNPVIPPDSAQRAGSPSDDTQQANLAPR